ncbi:solute carrier family 22 member 7-like [Lepisosteus oculatus]|uniref:solute carrier family 22 member 7-like n=1 Tax=Lepisosteus oculatus TaxID=7918 RepID=UPI0035F501B6
MNFETLLTEINGFGKFQISLFCLLYIPLITLPSNFLLNNFIAAVPSHHCDISMVGKEDKFGNLTLEQRIAISIPKDSDGTHSACSMYSEPQFLLLHNSSIETDISASVECQNGWVYDKTLFRSTIATEWDLVCGRRGLNRATATIFFIGVMVGAVVMGILSDRYGRKTILLVSYIIAAIFGVTSAFSTSYVMFAITRFCTGFGLTGISIIATVLNVEWVDVKHRLLVSLLGGFSWPLGTMWLAGTAYFINEWRWLTGVIICPLFLAMLTWFWVPESARWLIANGKMKQAHRYLSRGAKMNNRPEFSSKFTLEMLSSAVVVEPTKKNYSYLDLVRTPRMRRLALLTGPVWFGIALTYYGISLNITGFGLNIYLTQAIYGGIEIPAKLLTFYCLHKIGRRQSQAWSLILTGVCIAITIALPNRLQILRTVIAIIGKGLGEAAFTIILLYTAELYPTVVRQNGFGYNSFLARLGVSIAPLIMMLEDVWKFLPQVIFCTVAIASGTLAWLLPETLNAHLPETIDDVEQRRTVIGISAQEKGNIPLRSACGNTNEDEA